MAKDPANDDDDCTIPPVMTIAAQAKYVTPQPEHKVRDIAEYVEIEASDEKVVHCELVRTEFVSGTRYDVWDVHTDKNRWWVITNLTNLYRQAEFQSLDYTLSFHIGLMARLAARDRREPDEETAEMLAVFRKLEQVSDAADRADEVEEFQSIGLQCREALVALSRILASVVAEERTDAKFKAADFKNWSEAAAEVLCPGSSAKESRAFLKGVSSRAWDLVSWLTHAGNATHQDMIMGLMATHATVDALAMMLKKHRSGAPDRCPNCASYQVTALYRPEFETDSGYIRFCPKCEWSDAPERVIDGGTF